MEKSEFSIRVNRRQTINGRLLSEMTQTEALKHFKKSKNFNEDHIKKAHAEAKAKAKELDSDSSNEETAE